jgi:ubiquinone/menaquinone biosynthesis C-methylase UbiE
MKNTWTGERLETHIFTDNTIEHLHRYALACEHVKGKKVLDIASGEGYGTNILAAFAESITGVDISSEAIETAKVKYKKTNLKFIAGSAAKIPLNDNSVDVVVSFETIEHHDQHDEMMQEIKRVLVPDGLLIISSPNKKYYSDLPKAKNPFHIKELYYEEFKQLTNKYFKNALFYNQKIISGSIIAPDIHPGSFCEYKGNYDLITKEDEFCPIYNICVASDSDIPFATISVFDGKEIEEKRRQDLINLMKNSYKYRMGSIILSPALFAKNLFKRFVR